MLNQNTGMNLAKRFIFFPVFHCLMFILADSKCQKSFQCGNLGSLEFPLFDTQPDCGLFRVDGCDSGNPRIQLGAGGFWYDILQKVSANELLIREPRLQNQLNSNSCFSLRNLSLPKYPYSSFTIFPNLTLFTCVNRSSSQPIQDYFQNYESTNCQNSTAYYRNPANESAPGLRSIPSQCSVVQLPKKANISSSELLNMLTGEFNLEWHVSDACYECHRGGGQCQSNGMDEFWCRKSSNRKFKKVLLIGGVSVATVTTASIILFIFIWKKHRALLELLGFQHAQTDQEKSIEIFLKNHGNLAQRRYTYSDLKKMTHSFSDRLGKGGYGTVYKGKLPDGRLVAVKILNESEGNGEEFINEVASISKTSHVNIVALLGFCFEGSKRALIYEFMPSGSLEKFINNPTSSYQLGWQKLFDIVIGIAEGLDYLHRGCSTRIFHFDIKPHNILLDQNLNPKISDFGLAKLCPNRSSIVSMIVARGTIGYIAPEILYRSLGEVSHKSDVCSYGMMVLELVMGRQNLDPLADHSSEMYFTNRIYKHLEEDNVMGLDNIVNAAESQLARKMIIVGLWCIQIEPRNRPSISRVLEMLQGNIEFLQTPPKPHWFSTPKPADDDASFYETGK